MEFKFFTAWTILMKLGTPCWSLQNAASDFLHRDLVMVFQSKKKKRIKIITKFWKIITKSPYAKIKNSEASFCRSALRLSFCKKRFSLSQLIKKLNSTERWGLFSTSLRLQGDGHCACAQKWCHFSYFSKSFQTQRPKMTKIASRGPALDLSFWSFLTFLHHGIEDVERHLPWKFYKQI